MKTCPFCAEEIQDAAIVCKHCGRDLVAPAKAPAPLFPDAPAAPPKRASGTKWLVLVGSLFLVGWCVSIVDPPPAGSAGNPTDEQMALAKKLVQDGITAGLITRFTCIGNEAYVSPILWAAFDAQRKQGLANALAWTCEGEKSGNRITIFDSQSGKRLASVSGGRYSVE